MLKFKDEAVEGNTKGVAFLFKKNKIDSFHGTGRIARARARSRANPPTARPKTIEAKEHRHATGSDVARLKASKLTKRGSFLPPAR